MKQTVSDVIVRIDQLKELSAKEVLAVYERDEHWVLCKRNELESVVELKPKHANKPGEWAVVLATPSEMESKVRIGDVLARVNGANALLKSYEDMFQMVCEVKASRVPFSLTFRRAPFHRGWLFKRKRAKAPGLLAASLFSGATGWKRRFFVLAYGVLAY